MTRGWALRAMACLAAGTVLVSGCSEKHDATSSAPKTAATSAKASPTLPPLGPPDMLMPAGARQMSAEGFNAFARYYINLINRLDKELDATYLRQFSQACETCARIITDADGDAQKGYSYSGGTITITSLAPAHLTPDGAETAFTINQAAYFVVDASGKPVPGLTGQALTGMAGGMAGAWVSDHWVATELPSDEAHRRLPCSCFCGGFYLAITSRGRHPVPICVWWPTRR